MMVPKLKILPLLSALAIAGLAGGCSQTDSTSVTSASSSSSTAGAGGTKPSVVVTTDVLCDITKQIAKDTVELKCLLSAGSDPHVYQVTPADRQVIEKADLVLYAGHDFEPTLIKAIKATSSKSPKVAINEIAVPKPLKAAAEHDDHDKGAKQAEKKAEGKEADHGHDHSEHDPHVWHDAKNGIAIAKAVQASLAQASPANSAAYEQNTKVLTDSLTKIDDWIKTQVATIPANARKLVTTHDALGYYGNAYGIPIEGALQGLSTDEKPTAKRIKELVDNIKKTGVPVIFAESSSSSKLLTAVAQDAKVKIFTSPLFADGLGAPGSNADTYPKMLVANTQAIVEGLGGKFQPIALP